jgi:hypothetical protein
LQVAVWLEGEAGGGEEGGREEEIGPGVRSLRKKVKGLAIEIEREMKYRGVQDKRLVRSMSEWIHVAMESGENAERDQTGWGGGGGGGEGMGEEKGIRGMGERVDPMTDGKEGCSMA